MDNKEMIYLESLALFSQKGYHGVSIREITQKVGIKESSFYNHYASKKALQKMIIERFINQLEVMTPPESLIVEVLTTGSVEDFLDLGVNVFLAHFSQETMVQTMRFLAIESFFDEDANHFYKTRMIDDAIAYQTELFSKLMRAGKLKEGNSEQYAREFHGHIIYLLYRYFILEKENFDVIGIANSAREHLRFFMDALQPKV